MPGKCAALLLVCLGIIVLVSLAGCGPPSAIESSLKSPAEPLAALIQVCPPEVGQNPPTPQDYASLTHLATELAVSPAVLMKVLENPEIRSQGWVASRGAAAARELAALVRAHRVFDAALVRIVSYVPARNAGDRQEVCLLLNAVAEEVVQQMNADFAAAQAARIRHLEERRSQNLNRLAAISEKIRLSTQSISYRHKYLTQEMSAVANRLTELEQASASLISALQALQGPADPAKSETLLPEALEALASDSILNRLEQLQVDARLATEGNQNEAHLKAIAEELARRRALVADRIMEARKTRLEADLRNVTNHLLVVRQQYEHAIAASRDAEDMLLAIGELQREQEEMRQEGKRIDGMLAETRLGLVAPMSRVILRAAPMP